VKLQLSFILTLLTFSIFAQFPGAGGNQAPVIKGKIEGKVVDSLSGQPVGFATISLKKKGSTILQDGVLSEENGTFKFENVVKGSYDIYFSFLGYTEKKVAAVETTLKNPDVNIGHIKLASTSIILDAVEITEQKVLVRKQGR
jgi:hypothetical protein